MPTTTLKRPKGKMSMSAAAFELLQDAEKPMHYRDLTDRALKDRLILTSGKTPEQSLRSQISMEIRRKGTRSRFVAKGSGVYALSRFGKRLAKGEVPSTRTRAVRRRTDSAAKQTFKKS